MSSEHFLAGILKTAGEACAVLDAALASADRFALLLDDLGWTLDAQADIQKIEQLFQDVTNALTQLTKALEALDALGPNPSASDLLQALPPVEQAIAAVVKAVDDAATTNVDPTSPAPLDNAAFWSSFPDDVIEYAVYEGAKARTPFLFGLLHALGILVTAPVTPTEPGRRPYVRRSVEWGRIPKVISQPAKTLEEAFKWGVAFEHELFLSALAYLLAVLGLPAGLHGPDSDELDLYWDATAPARDTLLALRAPVYWSMANVGGSIETVQTGLAMLPIPAKGTRSGDPVGFVFYPFVSGAAAGSFEMSDGVSLEFGGGFESKEGIRAEIRPGASDFVVDPGLGAALSAFAKVEAKPETPWVLVGSPASSRLELAHAHAGVAAAGPATALEYRVDVGLDQANLVVDFSEGDGFTSKTIGDKPQTFGFGAGFAWSSKAGFRVYGQARLEATIPVHESILGVIDLESIYLLIDAGTNQDGATLVLAATGSLQLGPIAASVERVGVRATAKLVPKNAPPGNLGRVQVVYGFKLPDGAGLSIGAGPVSGGGFLSIDEDKGQYAGGLQLSFETISLTAIGLLNTKLPDGSRGFSLLVIITGHFPPIQLGFGFVLTGAGGLLGVNRTVVVDVLRAGVKNHTLDSVLFPEDPARDAPQIISNLSSAFPPAEGHYVFGPMAELGWGTPLIIAMQIGIALELPSPVRLIIVGRVALALPDADDALVLIQMDVLGIVDFDKGEASVDATLDNSRVARFPITGDMAMRANWAASPTFAFSAGGFNPQFTPPPAFPTLDRLAISLAQGDNPRLRLEAYLAVTSNTAQVGAHLDAYASADLGVIGKFSVQAYLGFDALFHFEPFSLMADMSAGASLKRNGSDFLSVSLAITLTGPQPWHAVGTATFHFLGSHSIGFDKTIGDDPPPQALPQADPLPDLVKAVAEKGNWSAQLPPVGSMLVSLREFTSTDVLAHPLGQVAFHQRIVPLGVDISRVGNARPSGATRFTVDVTVGGGPPTPAPEPVKDYFAAAQFFDLSDDEKISHPSFELMDAGLRFGSAAATHSTAVASTTFGYETKIIDLQYQVVRTQPGRYHFDQEVALALAGAGAAAVGPMSTSGAERYAGPPLGITCAEPRFGVARRDDLTDPTGGGDLSYTEALEKSQEWNGRDGAQTQVVRASEVARA